MYLRSLGIPGLGWIDDVKATTEHRFMNACDEEQFQSAFRAMVVLTRILFNAGYFLGIRKCNLLPEKVLTYLGIDCDTLHQRFLVPEERVLKYVPILQELVTKKWVPYSQMEKNGRETGFSGMCCPCWYVVHKGTILCSKIVWNFPHSYQSC